MVIFVSYILIAKSELLKVYTFLHSFECIVISLNIQNINKSVIFQFIYYKKVYYLNYNNKKFKSLLFIFIFQN